MIHTLRKVFLYHLFISQIDAYHIEKCEEVHTITSHDYDINKTTHYVVVEDFKCWLSTFMHVCK